MPPSFSRYKSFEVSRERSNTCSLMNYLCTCFTSLQKRVHEQPAQQTSDGSP